MSTLRISGSMPLFPLLLQGGHSDTFTLFTFYAYDYDKDNDIKLVIFTDNVGCLRMEGAL